MSYDQIVVVNIVDYSNPGYRTIGSTMDNVIISVNICNSVCGFLAYNGSHLLYTFINLLETPVDETFILQLYENITCFSNFIFVPFLSFLHYACISVSKDAIWLLYQRIISLISFSSF